MKARMRRLSVSVDSAVIDHPEDVRSSDGTESSFHERVRKLLSSPLSRRKSAASTAGAASSTGGKLKVFGSPLSTLAHVDQAPASQCLHSCRKEPGIPYVMTRLCSFIEKESGLNQEGLFRISANIRLVERLRNSFDESGDAPLEDSGDVAAAAALLKQFLRDLPQPVIPCHLNQPFFAAVRDLEQGQTDGRERLKALVAVLPSENFHLLKYICTFLRRVSLNEDSNRMNSCSLGIVFGPNIFRVSPEDYKAYKDQAISGPNQIVSLFISESEYIFDEELRRKTGSLKNSDLESASSSSDRKGKVKRRGASEGEKDSFCQRLNSHIIPILILNNETLSASMQPQKGMAITRRRRRESRFLGLADSLLFGRSASTEERPPSPDDLLTPLASDMRRCLSTDEMTSQSSGFSGLSARDVCENTDPDPGYGEQDLAATAPADESTGAGKDEVPNDDRDRVITSTRNVNSKSCSIPEAKPIMPEHRKSWPRDSRDLQKISIKPSYVNLASCPIAQSCIGRELASTEPPISPSAFRCYLSQRSKRLSDPNVAPSPPQDQEFLVTAHISPVKASFQATVLRDTRMRIHNLKMRLKEFDKTFQEEHARAARFEDKMESAVAQPLMKQLLQLRRSLRDFKQSASSANSDDDKSNTESGSETSQLPATMAAVQQELESKRSSAGRPEDFEDMTREQLMQEKTELQKALLRFESVHGRPKSKSDRDIVRPLYDRYRAVKRLVGRLASGDADHAGSDLPPILEHVVMTFPSQTSQSRSAVCSSNNDTSAVNQAAAKDGEPNLHELPLVELIRLLQQSRQEKRRSKRLIRAFESEFTKSTGRKVEKGDRGTMTQVYASYKHAKGRVRLLEALVTKTDKVQRLL